MIGLFAISPRKGDRSAMNAINRGFFVFAVISAIGVAITSFTFLPGTL